MSDRRHPYTPIKQNNYGYVSNEEIKRRKQVMSDKLDVNVSVFDASKLTLLIDDEPVNAIRFGIDTDGKFIIDLFIGDEGSLKRIFSGKEFMIVYQYPKDYLAINGKYDYENPYLADKLIYNGSDMSAISIKFPIIGNWSWGIFPGKA